MGFPLTEKYKNYSFFNLSRIAFLSCLNCVHRLYNNHHLPDIGSDATIFNNKKSAILFKKLSRFQSLIYFARVIAEL